MTNAKKSERIYITAKTRVISEGRARALNSSLNVMSTWYSFCLIGVSIANLAGSLRQYPVSFSMTLLSVALFGVSIFLLAGRITQRADEFRKCYLALNAIYHSSKDEEVKMREYEQVLDRHPNHSSIDYDLMVAESDARNQKLWNDEGYVEYTETMKKRVGRYKFGIATARILAFVFPAIVVASAVAISPPTEPPASAETGTQGDG